MQSVQVCTLGDNRKRGEEWQYLFSHAMLKVEHDIQGVYCGQHAPCEHVGCRLSHYGLGCKKMLVSNSSMVYVGFVWRWFRVSFESIKSTMMF